MRRSVLVLAMAALLPSALSAQQRDRAATPAEAQQATDTPATTLRNTTAPKSLMGMVMAVLIQSAEQQSAAQRNSHRRTKVEPDALKPPTQADAAIEQLAVQSEP